MHEPCRGRSPPPVIAASSGCGRGGPARALAVFPKTKRPGANPGPPELLQRGLSYDSGPTSTKAPSLTVISTTEPATSPAASNSIGPEAP